MEWLNYRHLFCFWAVCTEGGFSKAALKLRVAQSAVSLQVSTLERFFGEKLIERNSKDFTLTEAGQEALAQAESIFRQGNDLVHYFQSGKMRASFRVGALSGLSKNLQLKLLAPVVDDMSVELALEIGDAAVLLNRLVHYQLDTVLSDVPFPSSEAVPLTQKEVISEPICLISRKRPKRKYHHPPRAFPDGLYLPAKSSALTTGVTEYLAMEGTSFPVRGFIDDIAFMRLLALETDAAVVIPKIGVKRELDAGELFVIHEFKHIRQQYFLIYRRNGKRHPMLTRLLGRATPVDTI